MALRNVENKSRITPRREINVEVSCFIGGCAHSLRSAALPLFISEDDMENCELNPNELGMIEYSKEISRLKEINRELVEAARRVLIANGDYCDGHCQERDPDSKHTWGTPDQLCYICGLRAAIASAEEAEVKP